MAKKVLRLKAERRSEVQRLYNELVRRYGEDVIVFGDALNIERERIAFGVSALDQIIGGGIPISTIVEVYGPESVGKSTLAYKFISNAQKLGQVVYVDLEGQYNQDWAAKQGVDVSALLVMRPVAAEAAASALVDAVRNNCAAVVLDSIAAMEPSVAFKRRMDEPLVGQVPLLINRVIRRLLVYQKHSRTIVMLLNQVREVIGRPLYGSLLNTPGGRGMRHFTHLRLHLERVKYLTKIEDGVKRKYGHVIGVTVSKSKISQPHVRCELYMEYGTGIVERKKPVKG